MRVFVFATIVIAIFFSSLADGSNSKKIDSALYLSDDEMVKVIISFNDSYHEKSGTFSFLKNNHNSKADVKNKIKTQGKLKRDYSIMNGVSAEIPKSMLLELENNPEIMRVEEDKKVHAFLQESVPLINADDVWNRQVTGINITGAGETICVIDTGIDYTHTDLGGCSVSKVVLNGTNESYILESDHNYSNNFDYTWKIIKAGYDNIAIHFKNISLEYPGEFGDTTDRIIIYDSNMFEIAQYQGIGGVIEDLWTPYAIGDTIYVRLKTDQSITYYGFYIDYVLNGTTNTTYNWSDCSKTVAGWDFVNNDGDPKDDMGHGTHVSGIIAANGDINGVAPDTSIVAAKVLDMNGSGWFSDVISGVEYCVNNTEKYNISVISMSLGGGYFTNYCDVDNPSMSAAINAAVLKNMSVVVATGNEYEYKGISAPACIENVTRVGATTKADNITYYTNRGSNFSDMLLAPGSEINSTVLGNNYEINHGTSMATPHVSGAIALFVQAYREIYDVSPTPAHIKDVLKDTGVLISDLQTGLNFSRIDILAAINSLVLPPEINYSYNNVTLDKSSIIIINESDSVFFNVSVNQDVNYTWYRDGVLVGGAFNNYTLVTNFTDSGTIIVLANATNVNGSGFFIWNVTVLDVVLSVVDSNPGTDVTVFENTTLFFNITTSRNTTNNSWFVNGTLQNETSQEFNVSWTFDDSSVYEIIHNGTDGIDNVSFIWNVTVLNVNQVPTINMFNVSFEKQNQTNLNLTLNVSDLDGDNLTLSVDDYNITVNGLILEFNYNITITEKPVVLIVNDSFNSSNFTFYVTITDTIAPNITIISPENKSYNTFNLTLNFSFDEVVDWCAYSLNGGANTTVECNATVNLTTITGSNNITLFANDTFGFMGSKSRHFSVDMIAPTVSINLTNYTTNDYFFINVTTNENLLACVLDWTGVNETMNISEEFGNVCYQNKTGILPGTYNYSVYVSDLVGNINYTQNYSVEIYYCNVSFGGWSSCVSGKKSRININRDCTKTAETVFCSTSTSGGGRLKAKTIVEEENEIIEPIENETQNSTLEINETVLLETKTDEQNIIFEFLDKLEILKKKIKDSNIGDAKKQELLEFLENAKQTNFFGNISNMENTFELIETKIMDELSQSSNDWIFEIGIVILLGVAGVMIYRAGRAKS